VNAGRQLADLLVRWQAAPGPAAAAAVNDAAAADPAPADAALWRRFLETTGEQPFLAALPDRAARHRWAETVFAAIRHAEFGLADLLDWRVRTNPDVVYLHDLGRPGEPRLTFTQVRRRIRRIAGHLLGPAPLAQPRPCVGILAANTLDGALCDLACLMHDIPVAPLNIQEDTATLAWICDRLAIADLVVDGPDLLQRALDVRDRARVPFVIHLLQPSGGTDLDRIRILEPDLAGLADEEAERRLAGRPRDGLDDPCTVLFTSGSTGRPKGIAFTPFNLVSKRFARAAALPAVGRGEVLLAYLPLYHTFGRYLELLGMLYWGGTYVFAGEPSADSLLAGMRKVRPTGLVSVPLRWQQLRERAEESTGDRAALAAVTGGRLRWGLSAAGWLAPDTFRWFHARQVQLCSGFGMTEGTGGLTMTPPDEYVDESVGLPLPGVRIRIGSEGELQVAGPYIARYLPEDGAPGDLGAGGRDRDAEAWLGTGDLFQELPGGHLQIVDRIKDIYKNNRGQTVAPRKVESRFAGVPGISRTFLAGDGRPYNVLLIVPDEQDAVLGGLDPRGRDHYFHRVVRQANLDLAAYERVVNFAVLERDFSVDRGELTAKGSYRRKEIAANHKALLDDLYRRRTLVWGERRLLVPDWVLRDLGLLEDEIVVAGEALVNRRSGARLRLGPGRRPGWLRIGDLEYRPTEPSQVLDLGLFARQPLLWVGNPELQTFLPCRDGWDARLIGVDEQVLLPARTSDADEAVCPPRREDRLGSLDALCREVLFGEFATARTAVTAREARLPKAPPREAVLIRRRLESLAGHPRLEIRCDAYRILVLDEPEPDYGRYLAAFVASGQPFLCPDSIAAIARDASEPERLLSFRRRLHAYRQHLTWPAAPEVRGIFADLLRLLVDFARNHPENLPTVRRELLCWCLFRQDPPLAQHAHARLDELTTWHRARLQAAAPPREAWADRLAFQDGLEPAEITSLREVLTSTTFLAESVALVFDETFDLADIPPAGVWVSRTLSQPFPSRYRVSINTRSGHHFDLLLVLREDLADPEVMETFQRVAAIRAWPTDTPVLPRLGALRPALGAASLAFASGLSIWDRIRQQGATADAVTAYGARNWRRLLVAGMAVVITAWRHSGREIVPGMVHPANVIVSDRDWQKSDLVISLAGWRRYAGPLDLVRPLLKNFLRLPASHYPALQGLFDDGWLGDAVAEALGPGEGREFLNEIVAALEREPFAEGGPDLVARLRRFARELAVRYRPPLVVERAADRYRRWREMNADPSPRARSDQLESLVRLYRLDREGEPACFTLFRQTYLSEAPDAARRACDQLVARLFRHPDLRASRTVELSDLQAALLDPEDRLALGRLAFPQSAIGHHPAVQSVGDPARGHVVLVTDIADDHGGRYLVREPRDAAEMGRLYRLFLQSGFPLAISEADRHLVVVDRHEHLMGGVVWRIDTAGEPHLDGVVVTDSLRGRGLARVLLEDFSDRLADDGHAVLRTHFSLQGFFEHLGFRVDRQRGGLVKQLR